MIRIVQLSILLFHTPLQVMAFLPILLKLYDSQTNVQEKWFNGLQLDDCPTGWYRPVLRHLKL